MHVRIILQRVWLGQLVLMSPECCAAKQHMYYRDVRLTLMSRMLHPAQLPSSFVGSIRVPALWDNYSRVVTQPSSSFVNESIQSFGLPITACL